MPHFDHQSINWQNKEGDTPLHLAVQTIEEEHLLLQFLERGARLDIKNQENLTPIGIAYKENKSRLVTALCDKISNNRKIYLFHRAVILDLIKEIKDEDKALKQKLARAALSFENSEPFLNKETLDELVEISGNSP
ncbi:ankyrin repeat domain-containing protein [Legionella tunisiensis]|uniref:ankyrin repeat domain-containing protein n=1 Tax=Legionella tunisiensis TaxID=1034944 RepID=UPI00037CCFB7|nr:ankyrin repeat domain-containing protein [Legionella tunisiensis]